MSAAVRQKVDREPRVSAGHRRDWREFAGRSCENRKHRCEFKVTADPVSFLRPVGDLQP